MAFLSQTVLVCFFLFCSFATRQKGKMDMELAFLASNGPTSPLLDGLLLTHKEDSLLSPQDWDLASIESTLSPALLLDQESGLDLGDWLAGVDERMDWAHQQQQKAKDCAWANWPCQEQLNFWPNTSPAISGEMWMMPSPSSSSSSPSFCCSQCSSSLNEPHFELDPLAAQRLRNQQIAELLSPVQKFQECLQRIQRRLGQQQQRRKFSLKNGTVREEPTGTRTKGRVGRNAASRLSARKWREELKGVLQLKREEANEGDEAEDGVAQELLAKRRGGNGGKSAKILVK